MSKPCSVCSLNESMQQKIKEMHEAGNTLDQIFELFVEIAPEERGTSRTSIYRHLTHCLQQNSSENETSLEEQEQNALNSLSLRLEELNQTKPSRAESDVYNKMRNTFDRALTVFFVKMEQMESADGPETVDLMKSLDLMASTLSTFSKTFEHLYMGNVMPRPYEALFTQEELQKLGKDRLELMATLVDAPRDISDEHLQEMILKTIQTKQRQKYKSA